MEPHGCGTPVQLKTEYHDEGKQPSKVVHSHISILWLANKNQRHGHCM